jgi:hypothetical protein
MLGGRMMARIALRVLAAICFLLLNTAAVAQVHVPEPSVNLGDTSFLDGVGGPGLLVEEIGDAYHSGAPTVNSIGGLTHIAWLSDRRLLRARFGVEVVSAAAHVNIGGAGSAGGWGDVTVSPLILQWKEQNVGGVRIDQRLVFDFNPPTGEYQRTSGVNLGSNAFSAHPYYAITLFPAKRLETSWRIHYLWNATNNAPSRTTGAYSTQAGQAVHFNATVGYNLTHRFWIGTNGYYLKQITAPQLNGVSLLHSPEQVGAIGPGLMWQLGRCFLYANAYHELGVENRPRGNRLVLRIEWVFPTTTRNK